MDAPLLLATDALPQVVRMGINRRREEMSFPRHRVDTFVLNHLTGADARCTLDGRAFVLPSDAVHLARAGDIMSGEGTDGAGGIWRWVAFRWPGAQGGVPLPRLTRLNGDDRAGYASAFGELFAAYAGGREGWQLRTAEILLRLAGIVQGASAGLEARLGPGARRARLAASFIDRHLDRRMKLQEIAQAAGIGVAHLTRSFRSLFGTTPMQYLMRARLREARRLLIEEPRLPVREVCMRAGFGDAGHFARAFRRGYQVSPSALRLRFLDATG